MLLGSGLLLATLLVSLCLGAVRIGLAEVLGIAGHAVAPALVPANMPETHSIIVLELRLPRALLAAIVGAGLGMVGAVMQSATRNPLADPHLLGVSAGAAFGANVALLLTGEILGPLTVPLFAFAGALAATGLVVATVSASRGAATPEKLVLAGVAVAFVVTAGANLIILLGDPRAVASVLFWTLGGFGAAEWTTLPIPAVVLLACAAWFSLRASSLNALMMGDETATALGLSVTPLRLRLLGFTAILTATLVAFSGMIGFVGLMMPHIVRGLVGGDNRAVLPLSAVSGAIFLVAADIAARTLLAPNEVPVGIVTGLVGGIFFLLLLLRRQ